MHAPAGRRPKLGDSEERANRYQPPCHKGRDEWGGSSSDGLIGSIVTERRRDVQTRDAVANLAQAQAQACSRCRSVETRFLQYLRKNVALLLVKKILQILGHGDILLRRCVKVQFAALTKRDGAMQKMFKLPDVAVEGVGT